MIELFGKRYLLIRVVEQNLMAYLIGVEYPAPEHVDEVPLLHFQLQVQVQLPGQVPKRHWGINFPYMYIDDIQSLRN